jgi:uroporphyrin-3 C-methyltransferase
VNKDISEIDSGQLGTAAGREANRADEPRRGGSGLAVIALLIALAALLAAAWLWWQGQASGATVQARVQAELGRLDSNDSRLTAQLQALREAIESRPAGADTDQVAALQSTVSEERAQVAALQQALQEQATLARSMQSAIDAMHGRLAATESGLAGTQARALDARGDLDLAEVDYLLRLASERLQLFADPRSADRALALADAHLAAWENPAHLGVRQAIAAARGELAALERPDDLAIASRLDGIQQSIPALPFRTASAAVAEAAPPGEQGWWEKLKAAAASLVTVRRSTGEESRRISLQDKDYLRQRLWLQVEVAHMALMQHDQQDFQHALQRVQASLDEWFDPASGEVAAVQQSLDALRAVDLAVAWPDISEPWNTLRLVRAAQAPAAPTPAGRPAIEADPAEPAAADEDTDGEQ